MSNDEIVNENDAQTGEESRAEQRVKPPAEPLDDFWRSYFASPFIWLTAFFVLNLCVPFFDVPTRAAAIGGALALTFAYVCVIVFFVVSIARKKLSIPQLLVWGVLTLLAWLALGNAIVPAIEQPFDVAFRATGARPQGFSYMMLQGLWTLTDMALLSLGVLAGNFAARLIRTPNMLGPICVVIALIDVWGVLFGGIVAQLLVKTPQIAEKAMTQGPKIGAAAGSRYSIAMPGIGVGDYLFLGLLFGALFYLGLNWRDAMKWMIPLISAALLIIVFGLVPALPGLFFIALGAALPNLQHFRYTREEKFALLYAAVFVAALTGVLYWGLTSRLPDKAPAKTKTIKT